MFGMPYEVLSCLLFCYIMNIEIGKSQFAEISIMIHLEKLTYENFDDVFELKVKNSIPLCGEQLLQHCRSERYHAVRRACISIRHLQQQTGRVSWTGSRVSWTRGGG